MNKNKVFSYIKEDNNVEVGKLGVLDQIILVIRKMFYDESEELSQITELSKAELTTAANFHKFVDTALAPLKRGERKSVRMRLSSRYLKYAEEMKDSKYALSYDIKLFIPQIDYDIEYQFEMEMKVKEGNVREKK